MKHGHLITVIVLITGVLAVSAWPALNAHTGNGSFVRGVYGGMPRAPDGTIDADAVLGNAEKAGAGTLNVLFNDALGNIGSLEGLLSKADAKGIDVWVTILPPSGLSPERRQNMSYIDYIGFAREIAKLSLEHESLVAWSIDNVLIDHAFFTPGYIESITDAARGINPDLEFIPVAYYQNVLSSEFGERKAYLDGIQFYYMHFPKGESDETVFFVPQMEEIKKRFDGKIIVGIYASPWSKDYPTTAAYVDQLINLARQHTDGAMIYTHDQEGEKLRVIRENFGG